MASENGESPSVKSSRSRSPLEVSPLTQALMTEHGYPFSRSLASSFAGYAYCGSRLYPAVILSPSASIRQDSSALESAAGSLSDGNEGEGEEMGENRYPIPKIQIVANTSTDNKMPLGVIDEWRWLRGLDNQKLFRPLYESYLEYKARFVAKGYFLVT